MIIANANINLASSHETVERHQRPEHLTVWQDGEDPTEIRRPQTEPELQATIAKFEFSAESLAINISKEAQSLPKFSFDLDADAHEEQISFVNPGSGFLALDKNGDGIINNGHELFGPATDNGFNELAAYDLDGNDWIDEKDEIYTQLRIWSKDAAGNDSLIALGQKNVGAIYLGHIDTPFLLSDQDNEQLGQIRSSSIFLEEAGGVGTIQQLDLVV